MNIFKTDKTYLMLKNNQGQLEHIETEVIYAWDYEQDSPDFDCGNAEENAREMRRFESGELLNVVLKVEVKALGEKASDYLGQVFVKASDLETDLLNTAAEHDMKNNACAELKQNILNAAQRLSRFSEVKEF